MNTPIHIDIYTYIHACSHNVNIHIERERKIYTNMYSQMHTYTRFAKASLGANQATRIEVRSSAAGRTGIPMAQQFSRAEISNTKPKQPSRPTPADQLHSRRGLPSNDLAYSTLGTQPFLIPTFPLRLDRSIRNLLVMGRSGFWGL